MGRKLKKILGTILLAGASILPIKAQNPADRTMINVDYRSNKYISWASLTKNEKSKWMDTLTYDTLRPYREEHHYPDGKDCSFDANQTAMDIYDYEALDTLTNNPWKDIGYTFDSPVRYKLPVYSVLIKYKTPINGDEGHKANCIFTGEANDSKKDFNNWYFFDPASFSYPKLVPGNERMPANSDVSIIFDNFKTTDTIAIESQLLQFHLDSLTPRLVRYSPQTLILTNPVTDKTAPEVDLNGLENGKVYSDFPTQAVYNIHDGEFVESVPINLSWTFDVYSGTFLDNCWYKLNEGEKTEIPYYIKNGKDFATYTTSGTIDLEGKLNGGKNTLLVYRSDIAGNKKTDTINFYVGTDAVKKTSDNPEFNVYPNPVTNKLKIKGLEKGVIDIYDISGKKLKEINYRENDEINFSNYARGVYILRAENREGKSITKKVVKQ